LPLPRWSVCLLLALALVTGSLYLSASVWEGSLASDLAILFAEAHRSEELGRAREPMLRSVQLKYEAAQDLLTCRFSVDKAVVSFREAHYLDPEGARSPCPTDEELVDRVRAWVRGIQEELSPGRGKVPGWLENELEEFLQKGRKRGPSAAPQPVF
jgi:hypothetical protein